jgi:predicted nucleic acid-binding protein
MRFLDANVFIYAYLKPKRGLADEERKLKEMAKSIIRRVNEGEKVITSIVHLSEVANILENAMTIAALSELIKGILSSDNIAVIEVSSHDYLMAADLASIHNIGINDSLALIKMRERGVDEIYSFDKHFDEIEGITRVWN